MDALLRLAELVEENPDMSIEELSDILVSEGYAKNKECLHKFLDVIS
jgi:hypothetical protein